MCVCVYVCMYVVRVMLVATRNMYARMCVCMYVYSVCDVGSYMEYVCMYVYSVCNVGRYTGHVCARDSHFIDRFSCKYMYA
jgi:hypothetical protein